MTLNDLLRATVADLTTLMSEGRRIECDTLAGSTFDGVSLGLPRVIEAVTWKTFQKVFVRDAARGYVRGWNVRLEQRGVGSAPAPKLRRGKPITFGHFIVRDEGPTLLLDYGAFERGPLARLRDPLVGIDSVSGCDALLGRSLIRLGHREWPTPSFFLLLRGEPVTETIAPPGSSAGTRTRHD